MTAAGGDSQAAAGGGAGWYFGGCTCPLRSGTRNTSTQTVHGEIELECLEVLWWFARTGGPGGHWSVCE